jgi:hypothetical protein
MRENDLSDTNSDLDDNFQNSENRSRIEKKNFQINQGILILN